MKRFLSIFLSVLVAFSVLSITAGATNSVKLKLVSETDSVYAGDEFVVKLNISDNSKMSGAAIDVNFDKSKLQYVSGAYGGILDSSAIMSIKDVSGERGKVRFTYLSQSSEVTSAGVLVTLKFKALENASGDTELSVSVENPGDFISLDLTRLSYTVENANVKIVNTNPVIEESTDEAESESQSEIWIDATESDTDESLENSNEKSDDEDNTKWVFVAMIVAGVVILVSVVSIGKSSKPKKKRKK